MVNDVIAVEPGFAMIMTGIYAGPVNVTVERHDSPPEAPSEAWEETADVAFEAVAGGARLGSSDSEALDLPSLTPPGSGLYHLRLHCRGRQLEWDGYVEEPVEEYLIALWPTGPILPVDEEIARIAKDPYRLPRRPDPDRKIVGQPVRAPQRRPRTSP